MRFVVAAIILSLLVHVGYTQEAAKPIPKFPMPKDFKTVTADDIAKPPPPQSIPNPPSTPWFQRYSFLLLFAGVAVVFVAGGAILQRLGRRK